MSSWLTAAPSKTSSAACPATNASTSTPTCPKSFYRLYTLFKPQLTIMDARTGIEGNGPTKGKPVKMDLMLTGNDALAVDIVAAKVMMLDWKETYLNYIAKKQGCMKKTSKLKAYQ